MAGTRTQAVNIRRDYPAFTVRLPLQMYGALLDRAEKNRRSLAAEVEVLLEKVL